MWWERDVRVPVVSFYPAIIRFLDGEPWPEPTTLPERLLAERRRRGFTLASAAEAVGVDEGTYRRWESGEQQPQSRAVPLIDAFF